MSENVFNPKDKSPFIFMVEKENISGMKFGHKLHKLNYKNIINIENFGKNKIKISVRDYRTANKILNDETLKQDETKMYIPKFYLYSDGVVEDIDTDYDINEIKENIVSNT